MKFDSRKFEKRIKDTLEKETKKFLLKKGVTDVKKIGSKGILPIFKGNLKSDSPFLKDKSINNNQKK